MKTMIFYFGLVIFLMGLNPVYASSSLIDKTADTQAKQASYKSETLNELDRVLNVIYKKALEVSIDPQRIKESQIEWAKDQSKQKTEDVYFYEDRYEQRIKELFKDEKLRTFFLKAFFRDSKKVDKSVTCLAIISLWEHENKESHWYDLIGLMLDRFKFIQLTKNKIVISLVTYEGAYREQRSFFLLTEFNGSITIKPYRLSNPKTFRSPFDSDQQNRLTGNFDLDPDRKLIYYNERPSSYEGGNSCTWRMDEDSAIIIDEVIPWGSPGVSTFPH